MLHTEPANLIRFWFQPLWHVIRIENFFARSRQHLHNLFSNIYSSNNYFLVKIVVISSCFEKRNFLFSYADDFCCDVTLPSCVNSKNFIEEKWDFELSTCVMIARYTQRAVCDFCFIFKKQNKTPNITQKFAFVFLLPNLCYPNVVETNSKWQIDPKFPRNHEYLRTLFWSWKYRGYRLLPVYFRTICIEPASEFCSLYRSQGVRL